LHFLYILNVYIFITWSFWLWIVQSGRWIEKFWRNILSPYSENRVSIFLLNTGTPLRLHGVRIQNTKIQVFTAVENSKFIYVFHINTCPLIQRQLLTILLSLISKTEDVDYLYHRKVFLMRIYFRIPYFSKCDGHSAKNFKAQWAVYTICSKI
jgi:hypothetical protein